MNTQRDVVVAALRALADEIETADGSPRRAEVMLRDGLLYLGVEAFEIDVSPPLSRFITDDDQQFMASRGNLSLFGLSQAREPGFILCEEAGRIVRAATGEGR